MNWTGQYVGALVLDIGHSTIRSGYSGDFYPSQLLSSSVGIGNDYDVFPLISSSYSKVPLVKHVKYYDTIKNTIIINPESYIRSIRGSLKGRIHDKIMIEHLKYACNNKQLKDLSLLVGAHEYDKDCWDNFNNYMISGIHMSKLPNPNNLTIDNFLNYFHSFNSISSGLCEINGSRPIFIVESNEPNIQNRLLETEILFEELGVPGIHFGHGSQLASYSVGLFSSIIIDIGSATSSVTAIFEDEILGYKEYNVGGDQIDGILLDLLMKTNETNFKYIMNHPEYNLGVRSIPNCKDNYAIEIGNRPFNKIMPLNIFNIHNDLRALKESIIRISPYPLVINTDKNQIKQLPDGESFDLTEDDSKLSSLSKIKGNNQEIPLDAKNIISLDKITPFQLVGLSCEILFNPNIAYLPKGLNLGNFKGLVSMCEELLKENKVYRRDIFNQIAIIGGTGITSGFQERLALELGRASSMTPQESPLSGTKFKFVTFNSKISSKHASWIGASIISSLGSFHNCWISRTDYNEHGPNVSIRKGGIIKTNNNTNNN